MLALASPTVSGANLSAFIKAFLSLSCWLREHRNFQPPTLQANSQSEEDASGTVDDRQDCPSNFLDFCTFVFLDFGTASSRWVFKGRDSAALDTVNTPKGMAKSSKRPKEPFQKKTTFFLARCSVSAWIR